MKAVSLFAASVFAVALATSGVFAGQDMGSQSSSSQGMGSQMESQSSGPQSQSGSASMAATDPQQIRQIQQKLKKQGYNPGTADGIMGPKTSQALQNFQRDQGLDTSGQIDQQTLQALGVSGQGTQEQYGVSPEFEGQQEQPSPSAIPPDQGQSSEMESPESSEPMQGGSSSEMGGSSSSGQ